MRTQEITTPRRRAAGRKDATKQPAVMDATNLRERLPELKRLHDAMKEASANWNDAITAAAEECGLLSTTVSKVVKAWSGDSFEEERRKVEQLSLAFEEVAKA
jgi:hypothetical protein